MSARLPDSIGVGMGLALVAVAALAGVAWLAYRQRDLVNPLSNKNVAYGSVNAVGAELTGDKDFSLGTWLYNITHADEGLELNKPIAPRPSAGASGVW